MSTPPNQGAPAGIMANVQAAYRRWLQTLRRSGWLALWVTSGFWLVAAVCIEGFVADLAQALESVAPPPRTTHTAPRPMAAASTVSAQLARIIKRGRAGATAWRHLAARLDAALWSRIKGDDSL